MNDALIETLRQRVPSPRRPPLSDEQIAQAEARLGFPLPGLLRALYQRVGDGHFGPGHGILSLTEPGESDYSVVDVYLGSRVSIADDSLWDWPFGMLPICHWGCNKFSCVDCNSPPYPVFSYEGVHGEPMEVSFMPTSPSLRAWLEDWLAGQEVFEPIFEHAPELDKVMINPFDSKPMTIKGKRPRRRVK